MTFYFWVLAYGVLILISAIVLWCGVVNHIERKHKLALDTQKLQIKADDQAHKHWMEEHGVQTYPMGVPELIEAEDKRKEGKRS